jgi:hypothetical protein
VASPGPAQRLTLGCGAQRSASLGQALATELAGPIIEVPVRSLGIVQLKLFLHDAIIREGCDGSGV